MIIVFDSGNSNIKVGIFKNNALIFAFKISNSITTVKQYYNIIKKNFKINKIKISDVKGIALCGVVPKIKKKLIRLSKKYFFLKPVLISEKTKINFINLYENKKALGEDRIANLVAAEYFYKGKNKIIIDCGTAITVDVLNKKGEFLGGVIMPGFRMVLKALNQDTAQLPFINLNFHFEFLGKKTADCIIAGLNAIAIGAIKYLISNIKKQLNDQSIIIILTGGDSNLLMGRRLNEKRVILNKDLCLFGMQIIYNINVN